MRTVAVDFDKVIHAYRQGWGDGSIYDEPVPGALDALRTLMTSYAVFIHTTRDMFQVADWLRDRGIECRVDAAKGSLRREFWDEQGAVLVTNYKYPAVAYIDDRAIRFTNWAQALNDLGEVTGARPA